MKRLIIPLVITAAISFSALANADFERQSKPMHLFAGLDLSKIQKQDIRQIMHQLKLDNAIYRPQIKSSHAQLQSLMEQQEWDEALAKQLIWENIQGRDAIALNHALARHQVSKLLNEQQINKLASKWDKIQNRREPNALLLRMQKHLNLTQEQKQNIESLLDQQNDQLENYRLASQVHKQQERDLIIADDFDLDRYQAINDAYRQTQIQIQLLRMKTRFEIANILTEEQKQKFSEYRKRQIKSRIYS